jgi:transcriptional regulator with XRE-family HTH domain
MVKTLGDRIRELRDRADYSLREFADRIDVSAAFLSDIELGRRHPSSKVLARIAKALDIAVGELQKHDTRATARDIKRVATTNPALGFAFRRVIDHNIPPEDLIEWIEKQTTEERKRHKRER